MSGACFLSVVVPMYNEEEVVEETYGRLTEVLGGLGESYEIVFVNDGSRDRTADIVRRICAADRRVKLVDFSRNFGHQLAVTAGMDYASGRTVVLIDADLQDPPEVIPEMVKLWRQGYDVVYGRRIARKGETWFKKATAKLFYRLLRSMTSVNIPVDTGDFRLMDRKVIDTLCHMREKQRYIRGMVSWAGFRQTGVDYVRDERFAGETKYPLRKMLRLSMDAITSFSTKPLKLASILGFLMSAAGFVYLLVVLYLRLFTDATTPGWSSMVVISLLFHGITLSLLGVLGEYIGRIYEETKQRPLYLVSETVGFGQAAEERREDADRRQEQEQRGDADRWQEQEQRGDADRRQEQESRGDADRRQEQEQRGDVDRRQEQESSEGVSGRQEEERVVSRS